MATGHPQSQFRRYLSFLVLVGFLSFGLYGRADAQGHEPAPGGAFFLLSDASYGPTEEAQVRFEATDMTAVAEYGGADINVYRVPDPLAFLQKQKNLHRVEVGANYRGEGLANALRHTWDTWYVRSREAWRGLFSSKARSRAVAAAPELQTRDGFKAPTRYRQDPQYKPIKGLDLKARFRYPIGAAKAIKPPADVRLAGSSSEFITPSSGNVMIPIGKLPPGLYLVEAVVGQHRALTVVFVSNTVAITKISSGQLTVWTAQRGDGQPVADTRVMWTDGTGVLKSGRTNALGLVQFERPAPEQTYVLGEDADGGVFISENFYYDSEIYNAKLYAVTDRPLYRPGEQVFVKMTGRDFTSARDSKPLAAGNLGVEVFDPNGLPVTRQKIAFTPDTGADTSFRLPDNAPAGGYEIRFEYKGGRYGAAFRVANYQKPHFEIAVLTDETDFHTNEAITGRMQLAYPDGKPVRNASIELTVRAQKMTMVDGDLGYSGQFPVKLATTTLTTDDKGIAAFSLPPATEPSRYVLTAFATDGAAYRVKISKELLVERGSDAWRLAADRQFSAAGEAVKFSFAPVAEAGNAPVRWEWLRLEDRQRGEGTVGSGHEVAIAFPQAGSYTVSLRDAAGNVVAAAAHFVGGAGAKAPAGSIAIVFDRRQYRPGDTAEALVTFPTEVANALLTLERDKVESTALLTGGGDWVRLEKLTPTQWRAKLPVSEDYGPNITLSVVYVKNGDYVFQNQGLKVEQPKIELAFKPAKAVYEPGEMVEVDVVATARGKPVAATLSVGVVDEMIYVLQPEIAPDIFDFFYHPRRNNVRTAASLSFIGYDLSTPRTGRGPSARHVNERAVKVLERPRREDVDTAFWNPRLTTDANGRAHFRFRMPDSLTRWRITGRAMNAAGTVGQRTAFIRSEKAVYAKWTSPDWLREGDEPIVSLALFNQTRSEQTIELSAQGGGLDHSEQLTLKPGINFKALPLAKGDTRPATLTLRQGGRVIDSLEVPLHHEPLAWTSPHSLALELQGAETPLALPADATNVRLRFIASADAQLARVADDLITYPYGCVEQTASRIIPLALAVQGMGSDASPQAGRLRQRLYTQRFRLAQMAGPNAAFSWWGNMAGDDPFLTAYAYYADWLASRSLGLTLPKEHWDRLLDTYARKGYRLPPLQRALTLSWMQEMGLPVGSLVEALADDLARLKNATGDRIGKTDSLALAGPASRRAVAAARLLTAHTGRKAGADSARTLEKTAAADAEALKASDQPFDKALLLVTGNAPGLGAAQVLAAASTAMPTFERAAALSWTYRALGGSFGRQPDVQPAPSAPWRKTVTATGRSAHVWPAGTPLPKTLKIAPASAGTLAVVDYDSRETAARPLPMTVTRTLYRLVRVASNRQEAGAPRRGEPTPETVAVTTDFRLEKVAPGGTLKTDELYLDEIVLRPKKGQVFHYGLLEAALPPGAAVERTTWGISVHFDGTAPESLEKARQENMRFGYVVPLDMLAGEITLRHLLRFGQKGRFALPPARFHRMYQPERKAFETKDRAWTRLRVE